MLGNWFLIPTFLVCMKNLKASLLKPLLKLLLLSRKGAANNLSVCIAWYINLTTFLRELIDLAIKNPNYSELIFLNQFGIRQILPDDKLTVKLRRCRGEGQAHLENMLELIMEWLHLAQVDQ